MIAITWVGPPKAGHWATGRARAIQYVTVHQTQGSEGSTSAEAGAAYNRVRPDSVSCHVIVDTDTALRQVLDKDTAFSAYPKGNALGIHVELCHLGAWDLAEPNDAATFNNAADVVAQLCVAHAIPAVHLTVAQVRAAWYDAVKPRGICGHYDVTRAYPEDGGSHTDPDISGGQPTGFNWAEFIRRVAAYMGGDDMTPLQLQWLNNCEAVRTAWKANADTVWEYAIDGTRKSVPMDPYWAAIAARAPAAGGIADHKHAGGVTGPAQPLDGA